MSSDTDDSEALFRRIHRVPTVGDSDDDDDEVGVTNHHSGNPMFDGSELSLRQMAARMCRRIDIGTAVLPKPLFCPDVEDFATVVAATNTNNNNHDDDNDDEYAYSSTLQSLHQSITTPTPTLYASLVHQEFNAVVIEHHLKWAPLVHSEPGPLPDGRASNRLGRYDFYHADSIVDWCLEQNKKSSGSINPAAAPSPIQTIKGHVLVWHVTTPKFVQEMPPALLREQLKRHIYTCMSHFKGRISTWDVVNEALAPDGTLAENVFFTKLGPNYIEDCFRWAHDADPTAKLLYNDNKVEGIGTPKSDGFYNLLADLIAKGVPIHGCGIQAHFNAAGTGPNRPPTPCAVKHQIRRLGELGLTVNISEMDVRVSKLPSLQNSKTNNDANTTTTTAHSNAGTPPAASLRELAQCQIYHDILAAALTEPALDGIWLWGFTDRHTWVHSFYYDDEPCILDEAYQRKKAFYAVRNALQTLTPGHTVGGGLNEYLYSDIDSNGNPWGHLWMQPEEESSRGALLALGGDARPDWEQPDDDDDDDNEQDSGEIADGEDENDKINARMSSDSDYIPPIL